MNDELRKIILAFVISLVLIRFWIEIITTTVLKNSNLVNQINSNQVGFHHWQLGFLILVIALLVKRVAPKWKNRVILLLGFGLALFFDQYVYVVSSFGIRLPFEYRSPTDYVVIVLTTIGLVAYWRYSKKITTL